MPITVALIFLICLTFVASPRAAPEALDLGRALSELDAHPRLTASPEIVARFPRRASLYLGCHRLAFTDSQTPDPDLDRPNQALLTPLAAQRLDVMERFFDVLLADLSFATESEAMAVAYIQFDRARVRQELGQVSELRVLELEAVYQNTLHRRAASETGQQLTRFLLAQALGRPEDPVRDLREPVLPAPPEVPPDLDSVLALALAGEASRALAEGHGPADRALIELELKQRITELLLRLRLLTSVQGSARTESLWRDIKLDESRTLYDLEAAADLGYSMSQQTGSRMQEQRIAYCQALTWAELNALSDRPLWTADEQEP
ncbi:hypothetical protein CKO27_21835 [Thiocystis violacea]|nr:hypothetical protein [Thiocystis violacea]